MENEFENRLRIISAILVLIVFILIARVGYLQVYEGDYYARLADGNRIRIIPSLAPRGTFFDRHGEILVTNRPGFTVSLLNLDTPVSDEVIERLSNLLKISTNDIKKKIATHSGFDPIRIKHDVGAEILTIIEEQKALYPGVVIEVQPIRHYLYKSQGAHTYGYVSEINDVELEKKKEEGYRPGDIVGQSGLERIYDKEIRGINGGEQVEVDVLGKPVQILGKKELVPGNDLYLTIDLEVQASAEKAIDEQLKLIGAKAAAAVVMNPQTGEVLALVSRPAFDPNLFAHGISVKDWNEINNNPDNPMDNKAISGEYPPASAFKIITGLAALSLGKVGEKEKIFDSGKYWLGEKGNASGEALGWLDFKEAMAYSDNVYFYELGYRLGIDNLEKFARMFGLGAKTGINLPYEAEGLVASRKYKEEMYEEDWYISETLDAAIGQGFNLVTPLQAAMIMSQIAANGKRYEPYLVKRIMSAKGEVVKEYKPVLKGTLDVSMSDLLLVQEGLHDVAHYGTAASIFGGSFPIDIAAKTGTAENSQGKDHGWFVAYGPFDNPSVVVAVLVEQGGYGSQSAVPIGKKILETVFHLNKSSKDMKSPLNAAEKFSH